MNRVILQLLAVGFCFAVVQALQCYNCAIGFGSLCITTETKCASGEHCYSGVGNTGKLTYKMKGCLKTGECNTTVNVDLPGYPNTSIYTMTKTCCNTDLCNAAPGLPGTSGLSLALATITALFMANILV